MRREATLQFRHAPGVAKQGKKSICDVKLLARFLAPLDYEHEHSKRCAAVQGSCSCRTWCMLRKALSWVSFFKIM